MKRSLKSLRWTAALGVGALWLGGALESVAWADGAANHVRDVRIAAGAEAAETTEVTIVGSVAPKYTARFDAASNRLLVDITDADVVGAPEAITDGAGLVAGVLTQSFHDASGQTTRVSITLAAKARYEVRADGNTLHVVLTTGEAAPVRNVPGTTRTADVRPQATGTASLRDVHVRRGAGSDAIAIDLSGDAAWELVPVAGGRARLELTGVRLPKELERTLDVSAMSTRVRTISTYRAGEKVVVEVDRDGTGAGQVTRQGGSLVWSFGDGARSASSETGIAPDGGVARRSRVVAREDVGAPLPKVETGFAEDRAETQSAPAEAGAFLPGSAAPAQLAGQGKYSGNRIDLDLKDADVHNVLRLLADVGKLNVITGDNVAGAITIKMRNVPWDQALDIVLQSKGLGMVRMGNLVRVAPLAELEKEREMVIARRKQELELAPLETRLVPVSYAKADDVQKRATDMLSPRGSIAVDERTNVLIVRDLAGNLNQLEELVRSLDLQTPQVLIEARIVEATSRYNRDIGIQWGGDATFSPATGNATGLAFPSTMTVAGGATDGNAPTAGLSPFDRTVQNPNYAVNLPAPAGTGSGGALGLSFGSINNNFNLALRLSAAEASGMLRVVSSPRILTMDNKDARMSQGTLIPFSQVSAAGVNTAFQEARLQLMVKPHVTADGSVSMRVKVNRDEPDFNQTSARGDPTILRREAETELLVMDGHTAVIGGIYTRNTGRQLDQVPFFGDIPLLGMLFQRRRSSDIRGELVIFITPRIVNRAEALGH